MSTEDTHTLTGAYVLDALDEVERHRFEKHLAECPQCADEVVELRATAARLGLALAAQPPAWLRGAVLTDIGRTRQEPPGSARPAAPHPWLMRLTTIAVAVSLLGAGALGVLVARDVHDLHAARWQLSRAQSAYVSLDEVLAAPDARAITATGIGVAGSATIVVSDKLDAGVLTVWGMPGQPAGRTYQAWLIGPAGPRPAGLLGSTGAGAPLLVHGLRGERAVAVTAEPSGGSAQPTTIPVMSLDL